MAYSHSCSFESLEEKESRRIEAVVISDIEFIRAVGHLLWARYTTEHINDNNQIDSAFYKSLYRGDPCAYVTIGGVDRVFTIESELIVRSLNGLMFPGPTGARSYLGYSIYDVIQDVWLADGDNENPNSPCIFTEDDDNRLSELLLSDLTDWPRIQDIVA